MAATVAKLPIALLLTVYLNGHIDRKLQRCRHHRSSRIDLHSGSLDPILLHAQDAVGFWRAEDTGMSHRCLCWAPCNNAGALPAASVQSDHATETYTLQSTVSLRRASAKK